MSNLLTAVPAAFTAVGFDVPTPGDIFLGNDGKVYQKVQYLLMGETWTEDVEVRN